MPSPKPIKYPEQFPPVKWSIIFQIAAESDLVQEMIGIYDRIAKVGSVLGKVNFIVLYDGLKVEGMRSPDNPSVYYVRPGVTFAEEANSPVQVIASDNLMQAEILQTAFDALIHQFPADNWAYIYCGHGSPGGTDITNGKYLTKLDYRLLFGDREETDEELDKRLARLYEKDGWKIEYKLQLTGTDSDRNILIILSKEGAGINAMSYFQLGQILKGSFGDKLKFICLDSCWGQLSENMQAFMGVTEYLVGSVDEMPVMGIGYESFCRLLTENYEIRPFELASLITSTFYQSNYNDYMSSPEFSKMGVSLSCVSLPNTERLFSGSFNKLVKYLTANIDKYRGLVCAARKICKDHTYSPEDIFKAYNIDLVRFLENIIFFVKDDAEEYALSMHCLQVIAEIKMYALKSFIANNYEEAKPGLEALGGYGFTICFPPNLAAYKASIYSDSVRESHAHLHKSGWPWRIFLEKYLKDLESMSNGYSSEFSSRGAYNKYAKYFSDSKDDAQIVTDVREFVRSLTDDDPNDSPTTSTNKWRRF